MEKGLNAVGMNPDSRKYVAVGASPNSHSVRSGQDPNPHNQAMAPIRTSPSLREVQRRGKLGFEYTGRLFTHTVFSIPSYLESTPPRQTDVGLVDRGEYSWQSGQTI